MPACLYGAEPTPSAVGLQKWIDRALLPADLTALLTRTAPSALVALAASLVDMNTMCAENLDPPAPITATDLLELAATVPVSGLLPQTEAVAKLYAWMRYEQFLTYCQCKPPAVTPGHNCVTQATISVPAGLGSIAGPFPVTIDQVVIDSILVHPNQDWDWHRLGSTSGDSAAIGSVDVLIEYQATNGVWVTVDSPVTLNQQGAVCNLRAMGAASPKFGTSSALRIRNQLGSAFTLTNFNYCWCVPTTTPPPLPAQPDVPSVPNAPSTVCSTDDLCRIVTELSRRLTNLSLQVSDIQATVGGRDQLQVLRSQPISGEGEVGFVLGTRAISVELLTLSDDAFTSALGRPRGLMRVGSVRFGDGIGYSPRAFIDGDRYDTTLPPNALSVSWQLLPNATANLKFLG